MKYIPTIGLEVHVQLNTKTKMFCDSLNNPDETKPNVNVCPICLAHPGTLPVANEEAMEKVVTVGLALGSNIREFSWFERKNYFYPDLPKGYQISQYESPFCEEGELHLSSGASGGLGTGKTVRVTRVHLEEDTGRLTHEKEESLVDYNRAGVPLMELVTEPDMENAQEAKEFGQELQLLLQYLGVSNADMEKGQMRLEANVSIRPEGTEKLGTKVELKNINSFRALERAVEYEIKRQKDVLESGDEVEHGTRGWDENKQETFAQRTKEESHDYRYFPEPDLPPVRLDAEKIKSLKKSLPELPWQRRVRFVDQYGIKAEDARIFTSNKDLGNYFEKAVSELRQWLKESNIEKDEPAAIKLAANYLVTEIQHFKKDTKITPENFAELVVMIQKGDVSSSGAQEILEEMAKTGGDPSNILDEKGLKQVSDKGELKKAAEKVIRSNPSAVEDYKKGKDTAIKFLVGQMMRQTKGSANPQVAKDVLEKLLK